MLEARRRGLVRGPIRRLERPVTVGGLLALVGLLGRLRLLSPIVRQRQRGPKHPRRCRRPDLYPERELNLARALRRWKERILRKRAAMNVPVFIGSFLLARLN